MTRWRTLCTARRHTSKLNEIKYLQRHRGIPDGAGRRAFPTALALSGMGI